MTSLFKGIFIIETPLQVQAQLKERWSLSFKNSDDLSHVRRIFSDEDPVSLSPSFQDWPLHRRIFLFASASTLHRILASLSLGLSSSSCLGSQAHTKHECSFWMMFFTLGIYTSSALIPGDFAFNRPSQHPDSKEWPQWTRMNLFPHPTIDMTLLSKVHLTR